MIKDEHKLDGCTHAIQTIARALDNEFGNLNVHSGYRTPAYNAKIGGAKESQHTLGRAIDVSITNVHVIKVVAWLLYNIRKYPWTRCAINLKENWIHLDERESTEVPVIRFYKDGKWLW